MKAKKDMSKKQLLLVIGILLTKLAIAQPQTVPSTNQLVWADAEIGAMYHLDMPTFEPSYDFRKNWDYQPPAATFNPKELDTDQWIKAAKAAGATYAVLVAKHCSGFSLWPTEAHPYSVKNTPWRNGKGDIVRDFIASCKKYGVRPGLYASVSANAYCRVDNPGLVLSHKPDEQQAYNAIVTKQLTELWSNYGKLFEVWFDGGVLPPDKGGVDMAALLLRYQPDAIAFQGPYGYRNNIRWVGNEEGVAPYPCWARADSTTSASGVIQIKGLHGNPNGDYWCPGEADFPLRLNKSFQGGWFWKAGQDDQIRSLDELIDRYDKSVGRNTNMLLGIVVDDRGLVPEADVKRLAEFGETIQKRFATPLGTTSGKASTYVVRLKSPTTVSTVVIQEDIAQGERIREYKLYGQKENQWQLIAQGNSVGHKRIEKLAGQSFSAIKLDISKSDGPPVIRQLTCYE